MSTKKTSSLLIDESPLQVLPSLAVAIGLNEAIAVQQVHYWLTLSSNERDGRVWVYKTYAEWQIEFPFWSDDTVYRTFKKLEAEGILLSTDEYNQVATDRTKWYSIDYDELNGRGLLTPEPQAANTSTAICGSRAPQTAETSTASCGDRDPQSAEVEHRNLRNSRDPQVAEVLPEITQRLPPENKDIAGDASGAGQTPDGLPEDPEPAPQPRSRNPYFDAVCDVCDLDPGHLPPDTKGSSIGKVVKDLKAAKWQAEDVIAYHTWRKSRGMGSLGSIHWLVGEMAKREWRNGGNGPPNANPDAKATDTRALEAVRAMMKGQPGS